MSKTIIGVFSDSHKNLPGLKQAAKMAVASGATILIHLGDFYKDGELLVKLSKTVFRVPGLYEPEYKDVSIPNRFFKEIAGFIFFLTHSDSREDGDLPGDINPRKVAIENESDIYLYGHSHLYEAMIKGDAMFLNPGSLKLQDLRSQISTFGLLELEGKKAVGRIVDLEGNTLQEAILFKL